MAVIIDKKLTDHLRLKGHTASGSGIAFHLEVTGEDPLRPNEKKTYPIPVDGARLLVDLLVQDPGAAAPLPPKT